MIRRLTDLDFKSEEIQEQFHRSSTMLQVICQKFEQLCSARGWYTEVLGVDETLDIAIVQIKGRKTKYMKSVVNSMNSQFSELKDERLVCYPIDSESGVFQLLVPADVIGISH